MGLVSSATLDLAVTIPVCIPQTELQPNTCEQIASVYVPYGRKLRFRYVGLHVPRIKKGGETVTRVSDFYDCVYVGLYSGNIDQINRITAMPVAYVGIDGTGFTSSDSSMYLDFSSEGHYALFLVNNTKTHVYDAIVTGALRLL